MLDKTVQYSNQGQTIAIGKQFTIEPGEDVHLPMKGKQLLPGGGI